MDIETAIELATLVEHRTTLWDHIKAYRIEVSASLRGTDGFGFPEKLVSWDEVREYMLFKEGDVQVVALIDAYQAVDQRIQALAEAHDQADRG